MNRTALAVLGLLFLSGCYIVGNPPPIRNFLSGGNELIANALKRGAADWAWHGLEVANYVTVDDGKAGMPVRFVSERELKRGCPKGPVNLAGCTRSEMGDWLEMILHERLANNPVGLGYMIQHELIHVLVPEAPHLEGAAGITTANHTSNYVTRADMEHLSRFTEVTPSRVPFFGEPV